MCIANDTAQEEIHLPNGKIRRADGTVLRPGHPDYPIIVGPGQRKLNATDVPLRDGMTGAAREGILTRRERIREAMGDQG